MLIFVPYFFPLLWWLGVHGSIYTGSYNVSNVSCMNSPPLKCDLYNSFKNCL
jgi:hypothetical protein